MKKLLLTVLIVILGLPVLAQEISLPSSVIAAGGGSGGDLTADGNLVHLSRWRIGQICILSIPDFEIANDEDPDWQVYAYPNPVEDILYLEFELPETREFILKVYDASGRLIFHQDAVPFPDGSITELKLSKHPPALYLLHVTSPDMTSQRILRIQKH